MFISTFFVFLHKILHKDIHNRYHMNFLMVVYTDSIVLKIKKIFQIENNMKAFYMAVRDVVVLL